MPEQAPFPRPGTPEGGPGAAPAGRAAGARRERWLAAGTPWNAIVIALVAGLLALGTWMYLGVKQSLQDLRAAGLRTVLEAESNALELWVENRRNHVERWAKDPRVRRHVAELARFADSRKATAAELRDTPDRAALDALLAPVLSGAGAHNYNVVDTGGRIVAAHSDEHLGLRVSPGSFLVSLRQVLKGETRFVRPHLDRERVEGAAVTAPSRPVVWFEAPVEDESGRIAGALGFAYPADGEFANILRVARPGATGEAYAFSAEGLMLSASRFEAALAKAGLVPAGGGAILRVELRDPGGSLARGHRPELDRGAQPLTRLAALAAAGRAKAAAEERQGVILEPYRNYRGEEVIGAWRWLPDMDMGLAIEMGAAEAYAPLAYLNLAFVVVLAMLSAATMAVLWSAWGIARLRREAGAARVIGQYQIERELGEGGMARVYLARHALLKRPTALKLLKPHLATDEIVARFEREVQLASQLVHPNTIGIYDYGRTRDGLFYYVMEYLEGETLERIVVAHGPMPPGRVIHVLKQVCAALREAHGRGLVHRDVKPQNIMLCERAGEHDVAKILDFGLVKDVHGHQSRDITQFQRVVGTPLYMAPERMRNPGDADARSDIYSVGAVGFYLLTGRELFESGGEHDLTYHVLHTPAPRASQFVPGIPRRLDELLARCLAKERTERPHDVLVVLALLEAAAVECPWSERDAAEWWSARGAKGVAAGGERRV